MGLEFDSNGFEDFVSFLKTFKSDDLYSLFCVKEKIDTIANIKGSNIIENRKKLLEELGLEREKLFERFYDFYGKYDEHVNYLTDFIESQGDTGKTYGESGMTLHDLILNADKILYKKLFRIIFDTVGKDEIENVISGKHLEVDKVLSRVSIMVKYYFEVENNVIRNILKGCIQDSSFFTQLVNDSNCTVDDYINQFIDYYEKDTISYIFEELEHVKICKDYDFVDLDGKFGYLVTSIDLSLLAKFTATLVFKGFLEFSSGKDGIDGESEEIQEDRPISYVYGNACGLFDELFPDNKRDDALEGLDFRKLALDSLHKSLDVFGRVLSNLKIRDSGAYILLSNALDTDKLEYVEQLFLKHRGKIFPQLKEYFFTEVYNLLFSGKNFQLSLDLDCIVSDLRIKYEHAKSHIGDVSKKQRDELERTFLKNEKDKFKAKFFEAFSKYSDFFDTLDLKEFFIFIELFMPLLGDVQKTYKEKLNLDYKNFVYMTLEEKFQKSHTNAIKPKQSVVPVVKKPDKDVSADLKQCPSNSVVEKKELPKGFVSDLENYFGGKLNRQLARSLRKFYGEYKPSWYTKEKYGFDFDDGFFEILHKYGFVCVDVEHVNEEAFDNGDSQFTEQDSGTETIEVEDPNNEDMKKLIDILNALDSLETNEQKVDYYIKAFELFYDIKDIVYIKAQILNGIEHDDRISKGIESIFYRILNGQREVIRRMYRSRKRYYRFDVGYNTGYRVVFNGQKGKSKKIIIDFADHDTYEDRIPGYYSRY